MRGVTRFSKPSLTNAVTLLFVVEYEEATANLRETSRICTYPVMRFNA